MRRGGRYVTQGGQEGSCRGYAEPPSSRGHRLLGSRALAQPQPHVILMAPPWRWQTDEDMEASRGHRACPGARGCVVLELG